MKYDLHNGDCISIMKQLIKDNIKVDAVITDPPYQTTGLSWDLLIPFDDMWNCLWKLIKPRRAVCLFGVQPFTSKLILSDIKNYKYNWVWEKNAAANFLTKNYQPGKITEDICVFGKMACTYSPKGNMNYFPQLTKGKAYNSKGNNNVRKRCAVNRGNIKKIDYINDGTRLPNNILQFPKDSNKLHPTQKPIKLLEYLIKTYTKEGDTVLDFTMGSGSTGVACINTNRNFIGIELDENYFNIAKERLITTEKELEEERKTWLFPDLAP